MPKVVELDSYQSLEKIFKRDYKTDKFVIACYLDNDNGQLASYISGDITDMELVYLIKTLQDRRNILFEES